MTELADVKAKLIDASGRQTSDTNTWGDCHSYPIPNSYSDAHTYAYTRTNTDAYSYSGTPIV